VTFTTVDVLTTIITALTSGFGHLNTLAVHNAQAGVSFFADRLSQRPSEGIIEPFPGAIIGPFLIVVPDVTPIGKLLGQHTPLAASTDPIKDGIDYLPQVDRPFATRTRRLGQIGSDNAPFFIGTIAGIAFASLSFWVGCGCIGFFAMISPQLSLMSYL
jgi:hypothetical protein